MKPTPVSRAHMALIALLACLAVLAQPAGAHASSSWDTPAAQLAEQIAALLGPGQVQLDLANRSSLPASELPAIRKALEDALRSRGLRPGGAESANAIHITLSENARRRLWIAQIEEGSQTLVAMVAVDGPLASAPAASGESGVVLERKRLWASGDNSAFPVLAALELHDQLLILMPDRIQIFGKASAEWSERQSLPVPARLTAGRPVPRDPRGELAPLPDGSGFTAYLPGIRCTAALASQQENQLDCGASDDPWPIGAPISTQASEIKAFYNAARNYFTGVVVPGFAAELPPFYSAAILPASPAQTAGQAALLVTGIRGGLQLANSTGTHAVAGARDWGSEIALLKTGCGSGAQILASASGEAPADSLRAYELHGQEASGVSPPLAMEGSVMELSGAPGNGSILAIVRNRQNRYEVDRVTAVCP